MNQEEKSKKIQNIYELSPMQQGMLFHALLDPSSDAYKEQSLITLSGTVDPDLLQESLNVLIQRYDIFRTVFVYEDIDEPIQVVLKKRTFQMPFADISAMSAAEQAGFLGQCKRQDLERGFDLARDLLMRIALYKLDDSTYTLLWTFHHILMDGWCQGIIFKEWIHVYECLRQGKPADLGPVIQYRHYIKWLQNQDRQAGLRFWQTYLDGYEQVVGIPGCLGKRPNQPGAQPYEPASWQMVLDQPISEGLNRVSRQAQVTASIVFQALWGILIQRYNNLDDVVFGAVVSGRPPEVPGVEEMVGLFINTVPVRVRADAETPFIEVLKNLYRENLATKSYEYVPLADIQADSEVEGQLFDHIMAFENYPIQEQMKEAGSNRRLSFSVKAMETREQTHYDFNVLINPGPLFLVKFLYNARVIDKEMVERLGGHIQALVAQLVERSEEAVGRLDLLTEAERQQIAAEFNDTSVDYPEDRLVHESFREQAQRTPDRTALSDSTDIISLSYRELDRRADVMAGSLIDRGVLPGAIVAIKAERSVEMIVGILGILKAGAAFLPIDPDYPQERIDYIISDSGAEIVIGQTSPPGPLSKRGEGENGVSPAKRFPAPTDLAYVIYTSGTTGRPKGTLIQHHSLVNLCSWHIRVFALNPTDRASQFASPGFDASVWEIFPCLLAGASLHIIPADMRTDMSALSAFFEKHHITIAFLPTQAAELFMGLDNRSLRLLLTGGDRLRSIRQGRYGIVNNYGPTENTVVGTSILLTGDKAVSRLPIGRPIDNVKIYILNRAGGLQPVGAVGELVIGGQGLSRGYLNNPELTAERFWPSPPNPLSLERARGNVAERGAAAIPGTGMLNRIAESPQFVKPQAKLSTVLAGSEGDWCVSPAPDVRLYKTGDLGRWLPDGNIEFLGRIDSQVKIRGFRIELHEIEARLLKHPQVKESLVAARDQGEEKYLCAYIVTGKEAVENPSVKDLKEFLANTLPDYMIPAFFIFLEKFPLSPGGKIDRKALPAPDFSLRVSSLRPARDNLEKTLAKLWADVLKITPDQIGIDDDFFALGGHSLKATILVGRIHKELGKPFPLSELFSRPSLRQMADYLRGSSLESFCPIAPQEKREYYPLSSAQERFFILQQVTPQSTAYHMPMILQVQGQVDRNRFAGVLEKLIQRHESLRTSFPLVQGKPVQRIHEQVAFELGGLRTGGRGGQCGRELIDLIIKEFVRPFDLARPPLLRFSLVKISDENHLMMFDMHHIISDGTSVGILLKEFMTVYKGESLPPLALQYRDFAGWQHEQLTGQGLQAQEGYWLSRFGGQLPVLDLVTDFPRPAVQSFEGDEIRFMLDRQVTGSVQQLIRESGMTLNIVLLAALNILLGRYTGQEDIVIGTTVAGRGHADLENIIGLLIETLAMRNFPVADRRVADFLAEVKQNTLRDFENQSYPFKELIHRLGADNELSRNPVFDVMLIVQNIEFSPFELGDLRFAPFQPSEEKEHMSKVDITLEATEAGEDIWLRLEYCRRLFSRERMERLPGHFENVLRQVAAGGDLKLGDIELMGKEERQRILTEFNRTDPISWPGKTVLDLWADGLAARTDAIALDGKSLAEEYTGYEVTLSYGELDRRTGCLAGDLRARGVKENTVAAMLLEAGLEMVIGLWAILRAGGCYLPIDPNSPRERIDYMLADAGAEILLDRWFFEMGASAPLSNRLDLEPVPERSQGAVPERSVAAIPGTGMLNRIAESPQFVKPQAKLSTVLAGSEGDWCVSSAHRSTVPTDLAYIIYTSGSTGRPKGVAVEHRNLAGYIRAFEEEFHLCPNDIVIQQVSYAFDASMEEFFPILLAGGKLVAPGRDLVRDIGALRRFIASRQATLLTCSPQLLNELDKAPGSLSDLSSLRIMISGGDRLKGEFIGRLLDVGPVYNTYGPTESTVCATYYRLEKGKVPKGDVPIGRPIFGYRVFIMDRWLKLLPLGVPGELCIGGVGVSRGYLNNPELTAERFVDRLYRTGDLGRWLVNGHIEFLGRIDRQVKVRGFRIELGEIESELLRLEGIEQAVVLASEKSSGQVFLSAYLKAEQSIDTSEVKRKLLKRLPDYLVPAQIVEVTAIPLTGAGKIDTRKLKEMETGKEREYIAPETSREKFLTRIWQQVLEKDRVSLEENFFDLGGTSLDIFRVQSLLKEEFGDIPVVALFQYPTVRLLARYLEERQGQPGLPENREPEKEAVGRVGKEKEEIAVTGMACRFPGATDTREYWHNLRDGKETITFFTDEELLQAGVDADVLQNPHYIKARGIIAGVEYFDAGFFGFTPREAQIMDPQIRIFMQCIWHALEDGGYDPFQFPGRISLYAGASPSMFWEGAAGFYASSQGVSSFLTAQLSDKDFMCTLVSYRLNLRGPSYLVQTACSTSLVAIHLAVEGILRGECDMALAGGVSIAYPYRKGYLYQEGMIFSDDGHNRSFDRQAKGSVFGDGVGGVLLKRLSEAIADGDHIYAVIKGSATNNDGLRKVGYTAPSVSGQAEVIREALLRAGVGADSIDFIETHGTATPLGDLVEIEALKQAFNTRKRGFCALGTVKSNFGHLYSAAGAAGFIKTVLSLYYRQIPPSLHFLEPNPQIDFDNSPFYMNTQLKEWPRLEGQKRRAGVSGFGIGGTNAHLVLEEWTEEARPVEGSGQIQAAQAGRRFRLILLTARSGYAVNRASEDLLRHLSEYGELNIGDVAYTLQVGRKHFPFRRMLVVPDMTLGGDMTGLTEAVKRTQIVQVKDENRPVYFMLCGQGSQYADMGIELYRREQVFREELDRCFEILTGLVNRDLREVLYPSLFGQARGEKDEINRTEYTLPVVFAFEYALARLLMSWGIKPRAMIGYSLGEYIAACLAGVFSLENGLEMLVMRGRLIEETDNGAMTNVPLPVAEAEKYLRPGLWICIDNGPTCVVGGLTGDVDRFEGEMKQKRILCVRLNTRHAVHTGVMEKIREKFEDGIKGYELHEPVIPFVSNVSGRWIRGEEARSARYWGDHLCSTVKFSLGLGELFKQEEEGIFLEIGAGRILGMMVRAHAGRKGREAILNTVKHPQERVEDDRYLLDKLGQLWLYGIKVDWPGFNRGEQRRRVSLPGYPFEGKRYWIEPGIFKGMGLGSGPMDMPLAAEPDETNEIGAPGSEPGQPVKLKPRDEYEKRIAGLWQEQMGIEEVGVDEDFFYLNGSSLLATQIMARLQQDYRVEIPLSRFYEEPTVAHLADLIRDQHQK